MVGLIFLLFNLTNKFDHRKIRNNAVIWARFSDKDTYIRTKIKNSFYTVKSGRKSTILITN